MATDITGVKPSATCLEVAGLNMRILSIKILILYINIKCESHKATIWLLKQWNICAMEWNIWNI